MFWTDEADDLLIRLWDEGGSLSYVADGMIKAGYVVTRSAVSGRRHRLPEEVFKRKSLAPVKVLEKKPPVRRIRSKPVTKIPVRRPATESEVEAIAQHLGVEYLDNDHRGCKAIMPTRGGEWHLQRVCGQPRTNDYNGCESPYCMTHFRLFTNPMVRRA